MTVVGAVVSGCGSGPSQVDSAVILGQDSISVTQMQEQLRTALGRTDMVAKITEQGGTTEQISRDVVSAAVMHQLLEQAARTEGITITDAQVADETAALGGTEAVLGRTLFDAENLRDAVWDRLAATELGRRYADRLSVTVDVALSTTQAEAEAKARTVAAGGPAAEAVFDDKNTAARDQTLRVGQDPTLGATAAFGTSAGQVVAFQPSPGQAVWAVMRVNQRSTDAAPSEPSVVSATDSDSLAAIGQRLVQPLADQLDVTVSPRYGVWDPVQMRVVAPTELGGVVLPTQAGRG
ncbi:MAG: SurA N-terminal domain-containing protein [Pseudonocardia sp.]|nr:SurA N-terminal domain-containing protein [Pseudonocardia sp.]